MRTRRLSHPLAANGSCDLVIVEVSFKLGGHVVFRLVLQIRLPLWGGVGVGGTDNGSRECYVCHESLADDSIKVGLY